MGVVILTDEEKEELRKINSTSGKDKCRECSHLKECKNIFKNCYECNKFNECPFLKLYISCGNVGKKLEKEDVVCPLITFIDRMDENTFDCFEPEEFDDEEIDYFSSHDDLDTFRNE